MRMNRFFVGLLVLVAAVGLTGIAAFATSGWSNSHNNGNNQQDTVTDTVSWTIHSYIELSIDDPTFDFGTIDPGLDTITATNANVLTVVCNTGWQLTYSVSGTGSNNLSVTLGASQGKGDATVNVSYTLNNLRSLDPGSYTATVTYTATAD